MTLKECVDRLNELQDIWENGNQNSLAFCRYMRCDLDELSWELIYQDEDIPANIEELYNMLEDDIYDCWRKCKIKAGQCTLTLLPIGE